jgi:hypothetical protein
MLKWIKRRGPTTDLSREKASAPQPVMSGQYLLLHEYLQNRFADTVVLTFGQIESLLGFSLPDQARLNGQWWSNPAGATTGTHYADSWTLARRVATPNLLAQTVAFERTP